MAKYSRIEVVLKMKETGMVPIFFHQDINVCKNVMQAVYNGGVRIFEFVNRGDFGHRIFSELNEFTIIKLPGMIVGAGSIIDAPTAALFIQEGANFIVSPLLNPEMAKICNRKKILWIPGCGTVSEINYAEELGAEICKIFPTDQVSGPEFVRKVKGPCPWTSMMPTGSIDPTEENLKKWFDAGVPCVGIGSQLFNKTDIEQSNFSAITKKIRNILEIIKKVRT